MFEFFAAADNLERITPPAMRFQILTPLPIEMKAGTLIDYKLHINGVPARWRTLIPVWEPPYRFIDEQIKGPYKRWVHTHEFEEQNGITVMRDHVEYELPLVPLGELAYPFVRYQVGVIFRYREKRIREIFED